MPITAGLFRRPPSEPRAHVCDRSVVNPVVLMPATLAANAIHERPRSCALIRRVRQVAGRCSHALAPRSGRDLLPRCGHWSRAAAMLERFDRVCRFAGGPRQLRLRFCLVLHNPAAAVSRLRRDSPAGATRISPSLRLYMREQQRYFYASNTGGQHNIRASKLLEETVGRHTGFAKWEVDVEERRRGHQRGPNNDRRALFALRWSSTGQVLAPAHRILGKLLHHRQRGDLELCLLDPRELSGLPYVSRRSPTPPGGVHMGRVLCLVHVRAPISPEHSFTGSAKSVMGNGTAPQGVRSAHPTRAADLLDAISRATGPFEG